MDLGDRMKMYESAYRFYLPRRMPVIIRVDGKAFHTLTRKCERPFDIDFAETMDATARALVEQIQNARCAYVQSDEISILLIDYNRFNSQQWFDANLQKMVSISAAIASSVFSIANNRPVQFDSRAFIVPERDVVNYFIWRQQDWTRNSIQMVAQSLYSHKELHQKNTDQMQEMVFQRGQNWNDLPAYWKRGRMVNAVLEVDMEIPIFSQDRGYIEKFLEVTEE